MILTRSLRSPSVLRDCVSPSLPGKEIPHEFRNLSNSPLSLEPTKKLDVACTTTLPTADLNLPQPRSGTDQTTRQAKTMFEKSAMISSSTETDVRLDMLGHTKWTGQNNGPEWTLMSRDVFYLLLHEAAL
ncbi:hypothetical protein PoB_005009700 [Plakobranchus ocellatus]|uniref:Uncharacterized protein n=1 Tax=Plakobranchus ocellatus TaxID=259542 RepID=A0AAV4BW72_9GAST|nr:hypothetical protein PoB_005009700 [Plakobranchus ocellatus]